MYCDNVENPMADPPTVGIADNENRIGWQVMESCMRISFIEVSFILYCLTQGIFNIIGTLKLKRGPAAAIPLKGPYAPATIQIAAFAAIALLTAQIGDLPVWGSSRIDARSVLLGLVLLVLTISIKPLEQKFTTSEIRRRIGRLLPHTAREGFSWVFVCIIVGIGEEIIFRAVLFGIFLRLTGNYWIAATASAAFFALGHFYYGMPGMASAFFVALCLQWLVRISGGLYLAIGLHFLHNLINGILWGILLNPEKSASKDMQPSPLVPNAADSAPEV